MVIGDRVIGIGETVYGDHGKVRIYGKTTEEFGQFQEIVLYRGDLTVHQEAVDLRIGKKGYIWEETVEFTTHYPIYFRAEGRTEAGKRCLTNPIWVNP